MDRDRKREGAIDHNAELKKLQTKLREKDIRITTLERTLSEASQGKVPEHSYKEALERFARENAKLDAENRLLKEDVEFIKMSKNSGLQGDSAIVAELQRQLADARSEIKKLQEKLAHKEEEIAELKKENNSLKRSINETERSLLSKSNDDNVKEIIRRMSSYKADNEKLSITLQEKMKELELIKVGVSKQDAGTATF
jgi:chromosome segregation ATPase